MRTERDLLGELELPDEALYGIQTERARRHFDAAGRPVRPELARALAQVKLACAMANRKLGYLDEAVADAVIAAAGEVARGLHAEQIVVDALQGGAGTSTNMNLNEVIARLASRASGLRVDPLEHVNLHQSTNDTYPTAVRVACLFRLQALEKAAVGLLQALQDKEREFAGVVKLGRTQLRDAVPITLGREFGAYAAAVGRDRWRVFKCSERLRVMNLGGTAVGTGLAAPRDYIFLAVEMLREVTGLGLSRAENLVDATQNQDEFVEASGMIRAHAATLVKIARDLRLMASGPEGGLGEIELPAVQPGSSLMPGKINPVIPEMVMQAGFRAMACDQAVTLAAMSGELELNAFMPLLADSMLEALGLLERADRAFAERCVRGIVAHAARCREVVERSRETAAALIPLIGHERAVELARVMERQRLTVGEACARLGVADGVDLDALLSAEGLCALGWRPGAFGARPGGGRTGG